jgi:hypothetical protein
VPAWRAKRASVSKRSAPAVRPIRVAAVSAPQPSSASSPGRYARTIARELRFDVVGLASELTDRARELAGDAYARLAGR